jgi:hypothetical protein
MLVNLEDKNRFDNIEEIQEIGDALPSLSVNNPVSDEI